MTTLQEIKKRNGQTNAVIGKALGCSAGKAGMILQGRHLSVYGDDEIEKLAVVLGITFERCWMAMCESINAFMGTPNAPHQRYDERMAETQGELGLPVDEARPLAMVEGVLVVEEARRIEA
jgi:hypothetical protein